MNKVKSEDMKEINGWQIYRNPSHGKMVAYHPIGSNPESLIFETDAAFLRWLKAERKE